MALPVVVSRPAHASRNALNTSLVVSAPVEVIPPVPARGAAAVGLTARAAGKKIAAQTGRLAVGLATFPTATPIAPNGGFTHVTVTRDYDLADGTAPSGVVYFTPSAWLVNDGVTIPAARVAAPLDVAGTISIGLVANTDPGTVPADSYYTVTEEIVGQPRRTYRMVLPHDGDTAVDLSVVPAQPLTYTRAAAPARTLVHDQDGKLVATFTDGARTVTLAGPVRTFTEQKDAFLDQFDRTLTTGWGQSPGGGVWGDFNGSSSDYSVSSGSGRIASPTTNVSRYVRLNDIVATYDARLSVTTSTTPAGNANSCSLIGGWTDTSNHYRYRLTFNSTGSVTAAITVVVAGSETTLAGSTTVAASGYVAGQMWHIRGVFDGATHNMYAWKTGDPEPGTPTLTVADATFPSGKLGVRGFASTGSTNSPTFLIDDYQVAATWPTPPSVAHSTWVRLLPAPFTGTVDEPWLTTTLASTSPDVFAQGLQYITGGDLEAEYGPLYAPGRSWDVAHADDGTRQEGADWNDFLGVTGNYPTLAVPTTDSPEAHQLGCLDCSGYIRTLFGYRGGLPMCLDDPADFDGTRIPRRSVDQSSGGPGVTVALGTGAPPDLSQLLPGDVLYFDADTSNPTEEEGQIDHTGIYLGVDSAGKRRFLSARKVASGPTLGDLGGPSIIDGTALYARSLRRIRRF